MSQEAAALARLRWAKAKRETKVCPFCGQEFSGTEKQVYCRSSHQNAAAAKRWREKRRRPSTSAGNEGAVEAARINGAWLGAGFDGDDPKSKGQEIEAHTVASSIS